jgi:tritrans,polycis-undecaprenyl-diphosphate synthase [geranylgeranyl-diphosphate specific]
LGRIDLLPKRIREAAEAAVEATKQYDKRVFNIALAYSGRLEVVDAVKKLNESGSEISEESISKNLYQPDTPEPDMIMRTSGEQRVSNFLLWQGAYSELFFVDKYWPDIEKDDIRKVMDEFAERQRRYGK